MDIATIVAVAFGLSADAFAASIAGGLAAKHLRTVKALRIAAFFGSFQALMPVIGWLAGLTLKGFIADIDHWIAFALLAIIGFRMIYGSVKGGSRAAWLDPLSLGGLLVLSVATSIDALAVGISFALLQMSIVTPILVIGGITFLLSLLGVLVGNKLGHFFGRRIEAVGGLVLIGIGAKILIDHLR